MMAIFRKIHVSFWSDPFIEQLTPEEKYFYLYLLTNEKTTQCGIYEISKRKISNDTGYIIETVNKLIAKFENTGKVKYNIDTGEVALKNWSKYNDAASPKVKACINKELQKVKDQLLFDYMGYSKPQGSSFNPNYRVSDSVRKQVFDKYGNKCQKCLSTENLQIDHIIPRSIGGTSIIENLRCLCQSCNSSRPLLGEELANEIKLAGFDYENLCKIQKILPYAYSMRSQSQEEEEQDKEQEQEQDKDVIDIVQCLDIALKDSRWIKASKATKELLEDFNKVLEERGIYKKLPIDYKTHFVNWKKKLPVPSKNKETFSREENQW